MITQEQVIAWAREAGFYPENAPEMNVTLERLAALAYEAGRKDENEACAETAEAVVPRHTECGNKIAAAIRARREQ